MSVAQRSFCVLLLFAAIPIWGGHPSCTTIQRASLPACSSFFPVQNSPEYSCDAISWLKIHLASFSRAVVHSFPDPRALTQTARARVWPQCPTEIRVIGLAGASGVDRVPEDGGLTAPAPPATTAVSFGAGREPPRHTPAMLIPASHNIRIWAPVFVPPVAGQTNAPAASPPAVPGPAGSPPHMHAPPGPAPVPGAPLTQRPDARAGDPWPLLVLQSPQIYHIPASVIHPQALPLSTLWYAAPSSSTPRAKRPRRHARTTASTSALPRGPPTSSNAVRVIDLTSPPASLVQMLQPLEGTRLHATSSASTPGTSRSKSRARLPPLLPRPSPPQTLQSDVQSAHKPSGPPAVAVKPRVRREMPTKSTRETAHVTGFLSTAVGEREPPASAHLQPLLRLPRRSHAEYERQHPVGEHAGIPESASVPSASSFSEPRSSRHETSDEAVSSIGMPLSMPGENRVPVLVQSGRPTAARPRRSQAADKVSQARREPSRVHEQRGISSDLPHGGGRVSSTLHGTGMAPIRAVSLPSARGISSLVSSPLSPWSSAVASSVAEVSNEFPVLHQPSNVALPMPRPSLPQAGTDGTRREVAHVIVAPSRPRDTVTSGPGAACQEWPSAPRSDLSRCGSSGREQADVLSSPRVSEAGGAHKEGKGSRRQPSGSLSSYPSQSRDSLVSSPPPPAALVGVVLECLFRRQLIRRPFGAEAGADLSRQPVQSVPGARNEPVALTAPGSSQTTSAYGSAEAGPRALFENRTSAAVGESAGPQKHSETHHKSGTKAFPREAWAGASVDMAQQRTRYAADPTLNKEHPGLSSLSGPHEQKGVKRILTEVSRPRASEEAVDSMGSAGLPPTWRHKKFRRQPAPGQEEAKCSQRDSGGSEGHGKKEGDGV